MEKSSKETYPVLGPEQDRQMTKSEYCAFTKTLEHLGDRWSLMIVRDIALQGPLGFNALADGLPGISRSVLSRRLRKLEALGLLQHDRGTGGRTPYRLAPAGVELMPTLRSLSVWAERWVPEHPAAAQLDPDLIVYWLTLRVEPAVVPDLRTVVVFDIRGDGRFPAWLVLERGVEPSLCAEDPGLSLDRYVYVEADASSLYPLSEGMRSWSEALTDGSVRLFGEPGLARALPGWFRGPHWLRGPYRTPAPARVPTRPPGEGRLAVSRS
jgi:DNA-binding HxlR family transcriptional regulator